jgi:hypothetical protein
MASGEVILKTPLVIQKFSSIDVFIMTVFLDLESYLKERLFVIIVKVIFSTFVS